MEQQRFTIPEHMNSPLFFRGWRWSIFSFMDLCLFFVNFHCVVCSSSTYGFWLLFWYLKTFLIELHIYFYSDEEFKSTQSMDVDNKERNIIHILWYILEPIFNLVIRYRKLNQKHFELWITSFLFICSPSTLESQNIKRSIQHEPSKTVGLGCSRKVSSSYCIAACEILRFLSKIYRQYTHIVDKHIIYFYEL
jgi:hypothetical protein